MTREEAIKILASSCIPGSKQTEALETLIPELAESEDERIMSRIIDGFKNFSRSASKWNNIPVEEVIAYLEKQAEEKFNLIDRNFRRGREVGYREGVADTIAKQKEQKSADNHDLVAQLKEHLANTPKEQLDAEWKELEEWNHIGPTVEEYLRSIKPAEWSEEDEERLKAICTYLQDYPRLAKINDVKRFNEYCDWLKSLPLNLKKKNEDVAKLCSNEWNKEDEIMLKWIEDILLIADDDLNDKLNGKVSPITDSAYSSMKLCIAKCHNWLKSLPERFNLQPKQEWSEEDEACIRNLESIIYYDKKLPNDTRVILGKFLSNLRPQPKRNCKDCAMFLNGKCTKPHWKPSEEQMEALQIAAMESKTDFNTLTSLLADLMKL